MSVATGHEPQKPTSVLIGDWLFKFRNAAFTAVMIALFIVFRPQPFLGDPKADVWLDLFGLAITISGSAFRFWIIGLAYIKRGGLDKEVYADTLVTSGMFGVCRNPLYVGNALVMIGILVIHNNPWTYIFGLILFGYAYWSLIIAEEWFLRRKFGAEYDDYCARVNRFIPDFSHYRESARDMAFNWRRSVIKDYSSIFAWVATATALIAYQKIVWAGMTVDPAQLVTPGVILAVAVVVMLSVRFLKKRKLLRE